MNESISMQIFLRHKVDEWMFALIRDYGFSRCEIWAMGDHFDIQDKDLLKRIMSWIQKYDISPDTAHLPLFYQGKKILIGDTSLGDDITDFFILCVDKLRNIGVKTFILHVGENTPLFIRRFEKIYFSFDDVYFAIENDPMGFPLAKDVAKIIDEIKMKFQDGGLRVGACIDVGHANIWEKPPEETIISLGSKIIATHISDNYGEADTHRPPGDGSINWQNVINALIQVGYNGNFTFEIAPVEKFELTLKVLRKFSDENINQKLITG